MGDAASLVLRSLTLHVDLERIAHADYEEQMAGDIRALTEGLRERGIQVRTTRLNTDLFPPGSYYWESSAARAAEQIAAFSDRIGARWFNVPFDLVPATAKESMRAVQAGYEILRRCQNGFVNLVVARGGELNRDSVLRTAELMLDASRLSTNGFDSFRLGVSLDPCPGTPFFPFSYSAGPRTFSVAVETAPWALRAARACRDPDAMADAMASDVGPRLVELQGLADELGESRGLDFRGQDLSIAPYPEEQTSVVPILQALGLDDVGGHGTFYFTAILTGAIQRLISELDLQSVGFNGVMYSVLEDHLLCRANDRKLLSLDALIGYSTLCGCGLDMVPIPGHSSADEIASLVLDVAAVSMRLRKPLGVRLLPIPNRDANEYTNFDMDFVTNTRILPIRGSRCERRVFSRSP